jgi:hypothetical protein
VLGRIWGKEKPCPLVVVILGRTAIMETSMEVPKKKKKKKEIPNDPEITLLGLI